MRKQTPRIETETADFRTYEKETIHERDGRTVVMHLCEELVGDRWEPFYAIDRIVNADGSIGFMRGLRIAAIDATPSNN